MRWIFRRPWRDLFGGLLVIAAGLVRGDSVFLGDFGIVPVLFDALGLFFVFLGLGYVSLGLVRVIRAKLATAVPPSPPPTA